MKWRKRGLIYAPDGQQAWARKYAFPPTPLFLSDGALRMYVAFCDEKTVGRIGYVDIDPNDPSRVLAVSPRPVLDIGEPGAFDENGILPTCILPVDQRLYLYYVGYQLGQRVRYYQFQGLAVSDDGGTSFERLRRVPVIDRSDAETLNRTSAFVMREDGRFRMWYVGGSEWTVVNGKSLPVYNLRHLESADGINWGGEGRVCLDFRDDEHAFGKPWVFREGGLYRMFYSVRRRSNGYRLGYAESRDGLDWVRKDDQVGIDVSPSGWDSQMIAYSSVVRHKDRVYLFYNGNNCGETGFGYAELEEW
jgi:sucrose-6-phosphate hydrolase SacC (GH32 family)